MPEEWIVRVQGNEYGPVDLDELRSWRDDGRLIRENEVREVGNYRWFPAAELPEVFADQPPPLPPPVVRRMSFGEIAAHGWAIYRKGFGRFFALALLVSVPSFFIQCAAPYLEMPKSGGPAVTMLVSGTVAFVMLMLLIIAWPFSVGGLQLLSADLFAGRSPSLRDLFARAKPLWTRLFTLGVIVYGSYLLWTFIPLIVAFSLATSGSLGDSLITLLLLCFTAYMVARLFINFLFWQPAGALGGSAETMDALRESKDLARGGTDRPYLQRPLWRGAVIASVWLLLIIILNVGIELPVMLWRLRGVTSLEQAVPMIQNMAKNSSLDVLTVATTFVSCLVSALLRGWLAATFVVLYLDTRAHAPKSN